MSTEKVIQIASGVFHSLFLTNKGRVYSCGWNDGGQLGLGNKKDQNIPELIRNLPKKC